MIQEIGHSMASHFVCNMLAVRWSRCEFFYSSLDEFVVLVVEWSLFIVLRVLLRPTPSFGEQVAATCPIIDEVVDPLLPPLT